MKTKLIGAALALLLTSGAARAQEPWPPADQLGMVLASEAACALTYEQDAIQAFIVKYVDAKDMRFTRALDYRTEITKLEIKQMSASHLMAHCTQIRRVAKQNGFIK